MYASWFAGREAGHQAPPAPLESDDGDDPITEVPAPDGASMDVMSMVDDRSTGEHSSDAT